MSMPKPKGVPVRGEMPPRPTIKPKGVPVRGGPSMPPMKPRPAGGARPRAGLYTPPTPSARHRKVTRPLGASNRLHTKRIMTMISDGFNMGRYLTPSDKSPQRGPRKV